MFKRTDETKVLRDPIYGYIHIDHEVVWACINSRWFQRLRRIHQLGGASMVYHTADHTRFAHSLGVYEIVRRMVNEVPDICDTLNEREKVTAMLAGLLHDIGHGPYSHAFEALSKVSHEEMSCRIIEETEIRDILEAEDIGLSKEVADVIRHKSRNPLLPQLISSQLDADRMDYLLRDAYFTGTKYGEFDLERILRTLRVSGEKIVIKESGVYAVENYIMARYHMYWQVYYHPVARSFERMVALLLDRMKDLMKAGKPVETIEELRILASGKGKLTLEQLYALDEYTCGYGFFLLAKSQDPILADLADRIQSRRLFDYCENNEAVKRKIIAKLKKEGYDPKYYLAKDAATQKPYVPYNTDSGMAIWVRMHGGSIKELSEASSIVHSLINGPVLKDDRIYYPKEIR